MPVALPVIQAFRPFHATGPEKSDVTISESKDGGRCPVDG